MYREEIEQIKQAMEEYPLCALSSLKSRTSKFKKHWFGAPN